MRILNFLHIGKNAGTQIRQVADQVMAENSELQITRHPHKTHLIDLPKDTEYFFSIREPISRFRSGFYSRKRKGRPRLNVEWSPDEKIAFETFPHANDLAEALYVPGPRSVAALCAMRSISHVSAMQTDHFHRQGYFLLTRPPLAILRQDKLEDDFRDFLNRLGYRGAVSFATESAVAHANDYSGTPDLSDKARANLVIWYAQDIVFYKMCCAWIEAQAQLTAVEPDTAAPALDMSVVKELHQAGSLGEFLSPR